MNQQNTVTNRPSSKVAIVYQYLAHYRITIARALCAQDINKYPEYTWISGTSQNAAQSSLQTIDPSWSTTPIKEGGFRWRFITNYWLYKTILWQRGLLKIGSNKEFDCIIYLGDMHYLSTWLGAIISRIRGKRVLMWSHGFYGNESTIKSKLRQVFFKLAHGVLLYGNHARNIMIDMGFNSEQLYVVYNSLDYASQLEHRRNTSSTAIADMKKKLFDNPTLPVVVFSGRLLKSKGLNLLIEAISIVRLGGSDVNLLIVGDGPDRKNLEEQVSRFNLAGNTAFYGECYSEKELAILFGLSDLCVSPEGVGLTAMHAMAYGVPVITHNEPTLQKPEFEAIIPGKTGDFFIKGDPKALADSIFVWIGKDRTEGSIFRNCVQVIEKLYNAESQTNIINLAVLGQNANSVLDVFGPDTLDLT